MTPTPVLWAVVVVAAIVLAVVIGWEERRVHEERNYARALRRRVDVDEQQLDALRGPRRNADQVRGIGL